MGLQIKNMLLQQIHHPVHHKNPKIPVNEENITILIRIQNSFPGTGKGSAC